MFWCEWASVSSHIVQKERIRAYPVTFLTGLQCTKEITMSSTDLNFWSLWPDAILKKKKWLVKICTGSRIVLRCCNLPHIKAMCRNLPQCSKTVWAHVHIRPIWQVDSHAKSTVIAGSGTAWIIAAPHRLPKFLYYICQLPGGFV